jgi:hypothetical protein
VRDVVDDITIPLLVLDPEDEQFVPGQPQELYEMLAKEKEIIKFRRRGANFHCQLLGRYLSDTLTLDWLQDHLPGRYQ